MLPLSIPPRKTPVPLATKWPDASSAEPGRSPNGDPIIPDVDIINNKVEFMPGPGSRAVQRSCLGLVSPKCNTLMQTAVG